MEKSDRQSSCHENIRERDIKRDFDEEETYEVVRHLDDSFL